MASPKPVSVDRLGDCANRRLPAKAKRGRRSADTSVTREYLEANFVLYFAAALFLALLWNWFGVQWADPPTSDTQLWVLIDVTLPLLLISTGFQLLRDSSN